MRRDTPCETQWACKPLILLREKENQQEIIQPTRMVNKIIPQSLPIKRHRLTYWIKNLDSTTCCLQKRHTLLIKPLKDWRLKNGKSSKQKLKTRWASYSDIWKQNSDQVIRDSKSNYILTKGTLYHDVTVINICASNTVKHAFINTNEHKRSNR